MHRPAAVFLDRDGVINRAIVKGGAAHSPLSVAELSIPSGVPEALHRLRRAGFAIVVVTNQPNVARGIQSRAVIEAMHAHLGSLLTIDEFRVCYHDDHDRCACRKPEPGLILQAPRFAIEDSFMIGDRWRDISAGYRAGCRANILIGDGYGEPFPVAADVQCGSVQQAADWILRAGCGRRDE